MAVKFYLDEHAHPAIAKALEQREIDVLTAQQTEMLGVADEEHLRFAASQGRVVFTQDDDFLALHWKMKHSGIAYAHQRTAMKRIIEGLVLIHSALTEEDMKNHVEYL